MRIADLLRAAVSLLATGLPLLEQSYTLLPVTDRVREAALPAAMLATLLCVIAGYATARHSLRGLQVGWTSLILFLVVVVTLFVSADLVPRGDRGLYILCFALFGLSAASFLCIRQEHEAEQPPTPAVRW